MLVDDSKKLHRQPKNDQKPKTDLEDRHLYNYLYVT